MQFARCKNALKYICGRGGTWTSLEELTLRALLSQITITFHCDNLRRSKFVVLENLANFGNFFSCFVATL